MNMLKLAIGIDGLPYGLRAELEVAHRRNDLDNDFFVVGLGSRDSRGDLTATTVMANVLYDFELAPSFDVYVGGGLGVAFVDVDFRRGPTVPNFTLARGDYAAFAYQAIVGASYEIVDDVSLFAQYAYTAALESDFSISATAAPNDSTQSGFDYNTHTVWGGVRVSFDVFQ